MERYQQLERFACDLGGDVTYSSLCRGWDGRASAGAGEVLLLEMAGAKRSTCAF